MRTRSLALLFLSLLLGSGCTVTVEGGWTPVGSDMAVYGAYDVERPGLTLAEACADAGIDTVELVILDSTGTYEYTSSDLTAFCEDGVVDSVYAVLAAGNYQYVWRAYDSFGYLVEESAAAWLNVSATDAGYYDADYHGFGNVYIDVTMSYEWWDALGTYGTCNEAGADVVPFAWTLTDAAKTVLYSNGLDTFCPNAIVIDDSFADYLYAGETYYLEIWSTNTTGSWWEASDVQSTTCLINVDYYGDTFADCAAPVFF